MLVFMFLKRDNKKIQVNKKIDIPDLINSLAKKKRKIVAFPIFENWHDIGQMKNLLKLESYTLRKTRR